MALPSGYTELEYLESTGTQFIDLNLNWSLYYSVEIDAEIINASGTVSLFGIHDARFTYPNIYTLGTLPVNAQNNFALVIVRDQSDSTNFITPYISGRHTWKSTMVPATVLGTITFSVDGTAVQSKTYTSGTSGSNSKYYLFGAHYISSSENTVINSGNIRIYEATITNSQNHTVLRHLVPAQRNADGVLGMYDTSHSVFYTNAGTGEFNRDGIDPPSSLTVSSDITIGESVSVLWGASTAEGVTGYELERSVNGGAFSQIYSGTGYFYTDTAEIGWETVVYRVRAVTAEEESGWVSSGSLPVVNPYAPTSLNLSEQYKAYLAALGRPFKKIVRLEFLQPDDTVAFALGGAGQKFPIAGRDTRAFLQSGSVSVDLANGARRRASVVLANRDGAFDFAVGKLWFGQRVRISMGMILPNGEDFYFPMGVFYIENPSALTSPGERTITLSLTDKWAYLDGSLFGGLEAAYSVTTGTNIFSAIDSLIHLSKYTYSSTSIRSDMIDPAAATYTTYYNGKTYYASRSDGSISSNINMTATPYTITENRGSTIGAVILKLNEMLAGWIGYDAFGALRLEPSQDDIDDADKPVLFAFTPENSVLLSMTEAAQTSSVYNDVTIAGQGLTNAAVWARAVNADPASDTNINLIGRRIYVEEKADYWNTDQCASLARWMLKRKSILQKSITIECGQMFHLIENRLVSVKRTDKPGSPVEKHLIQGFTVPIGESGSMSVSCVSVNDIPDFTITTSVS